MKKLCLLAAIMALITIHAAYAGWGELGWGNCEGGWGLCDAAAVAEVTAATGGSTGGGGGSLNRCQPLTDAFKQCYYYSLNQNACVKGCPESFSCNKDLQCVQIAKPITSLPIKKEFQEFTLFQNIWLKLKNGFDSFLGFAKSGFDSSASLSIEQQETSMAQAEQRVEAIVIAQEIANKPIEQIKQHPYMALSIAGIIAIVLAFIQFNMVLFMPPMVFYIIAYYVIVAILWFFKVLD